MNYVVRDYSLWRSSVGRKRAGGGEFIGQFGKPSHPTMELYFAFTDSDAATTWTASSMQIDKAPISSETNMSQMTASTPRASQFDHTMLPATDPSPPLNRFRLCQAMRSCVASTKGHTNHRWRRSK